MDAMSRSDDIYPKFDAVLMVHKLVEDDMIVLFPGQQYSYFSIPDASYVLRQIMRICVLSPGQI